MIHSSQDTKNTGYWITKQPWLTKPNVDICYIIIFFRVVKMLLSSTSAAMSCNCELETIHGHHSIVSIIVLISRYAGWWIDMFFSLETVSKTQLAYPPQVWDMKILCLLCLCNFWWPYSPVLSTILLFLYIHVSHILFESVFIMSKGSPNFL